LTVCNEPVCLGRNDLAISMSGIKAVHRHPLVLARHATVIEIMATHKSIALVGAHTQKLVLARGAPNSERTKIQIIGILGKDVMPLTTHGLSTLKFRIQPLHVHD
jgi:hypothetical protein